MREQTVRRDLYSRVGRAPVARKPTDDAQPGCPLCRLYVLRLRCPQQSEPGSDSRHALLFEKRRELFQKALVSLQFESQTTPQGQIVSDGFLQSFHRAPPGQASARVRSAVKSTLA